MALLIGPVVALLGVFAAFVVLRTRARTRHSLYSARRTMLEARAMERRERALAPEPPPAPVAAGSAPAIMEPSVSPATVAEPLSASQLPAAPSASPPAWDTSPLPQPPAPAQPAPAAATVPVPAFRSTASVEPPPVEVPATIEPPAPEPEPLPDTAAEPPAEQKAPAEAWSIVEPKAKEPRAERSSAAAGQLDEKQPAWDVVPHQRHTRDEDGLLTQPVPYTRRQSTVQNVLSYVVLVGALVVVLLGVLLMLATSH